MVKDEDPCAICKTPVLRRREHILVSGKPAAVRIDCPRCGPHIMTTHQEWQFVSDAPSIDPLFSCWIREHAGTERLVDLRDLNIQQIQEDLPRFSVPYKLNKVLRFLAERTETPGTTARFHLKHDGSLVWVSDEEEFEFYLRTLRDRNLITIAGTTGPEVSAGVTAEGWERVDELGRSDSRGGRAFVAMWFDESMRSVYDHAIEPAIREAGFDPYRVDDEDTGERIDARIMNDIEESRFVVADVTGQRNSVYFEAGYALALGRPVIWSVQQDELGKAAFDTRQFPHIAWTNPNELRTELVERIKVRIGARQRS